VTGFTEGERAVFDAMQRIDALAAARGLPPLGTEERGCLLLTDDESGDADDALAFIDDMRDRVFSPCTPDESAALDALTDCVLELAAEIDAMNRREADERI
jgi:hypothetical protein